MTNLNQLKNQLSLNYPSSDEFFESQLVYVGLDPLDEYEGGFKYDSALYFTIFGLLTGAHKISESGYTVELNIEGLKYMIKLLCNKYGWSDPTSDLGEIKNATNLW